MSQSDETPELPDFGLFTPEESALVQSVLHSETWRLIEDALTKAREDLFSGLSTIPGLSGQPEGNQALWQNRGAILLIQHLLREGPNLVIWYNRFMATQPAQKPRERAVPKGPEREYVPGDEGPDFNL